MRALLTLLRESPNRRGLLLFMATAVLSLVGGFVLVTPQEAETLISAGGYYYIFGLFALFGFYGLRVAAARRAVWRGWFRAPGVVGCVLLGASAFCIWADPFKHKILFDEYVLQGTAFHMHATKEVGTIVRAYDIWGTWVPIDTFLDKRPYFFAFMVSLLHDVSGYRAANAFVLNSALAAVFLALTFWLGRGLGGRGPALLAVGLLGTMPLLAQQASGAGMELHNLTMLALVVALAVLYLRAPSRDRLSLLVLGTILLAQSRYESVIYVACTAVVIVAGWMRAGQIFLSWPAITAPLLLVPYAWHNRMLSATPKLWQLGAGQTSRFSLDYLGGNLKGAWNFFFNLTPELANSWYLSALGMVAVLWVLGAAWRWARAERRPAVSPEVFALAAFGAGIAGNLCLLMFYYWSRLDDVIASRFALPMCFLLALLTACFFRRLEARTSFATRFGAAGLGVWLFGWCVPAVAQHNYTSQNLVMKEVEWEHDQLLTRRGPLLFISNKSTIPFVLWHVPTLLTTVARLRTERIRYHFNAGTFREVLVAQALRPTSRDGDMGVDPDDLLPETFHLETVAQKRFGARWARISRLVAIDPPPATSPGPTAPALTSVPPGSGTATTASLSP